ncbi:MAG: hypothetical protein JNK38_01660 [Acidobacteria bacterium]|nr:hypothetical protein [Acidobacteriota bacterium]
MLTKTIKLLSLLLAVCLTGSALAQSNTQSSQNSQQATKTEPQYVDFQGFKGKILEVKHRDLNLLVSALSPLGSGFKGAQLKANHDFKTITVRDFPENIAAIEEALKRLDVPSPPKPAEPPAPPKPDVEIYGYLLIASQGDAATNDYPKVIEDVVKQLQTNLNYKSYRLLTPIVQRTRIGGNLSSSGTASLSDKSVMANYEFNINRISSENETGSVWPLVMNNLDLRFNGINSSDGPGIGSARLTTGLRLNDGEKVVVGTASLRDKALILVLTTKVLK